MGSFLLLYFLTGGVNAELKRVMLFDAVGFGLLLAAFTAYRISRR